MRACRPGAMLLAAALCTMLASCTQLKTLRRADSFSADEQLEYLVLAAIAPEAAREYATTSTVRGRADFLEWFWTRPDLPTGLSRAAYLERARAARDLFGRIDLLGDERIPAYIRFGPPRREQFEPRPLETETTRTFVNPAETWTYDSLGRQLDFVRSGTAFRLVGETRFGPAWFPPEFRSADTNLPEPAPGGGAPQFAIDLVLGRLRQIADSVETEVQFGVEGAALAALPQSENRLAHVRIDAAARGGRRVSRSFWTSYLPDSGPVVGRQILWLPADVYRVTVSITRPDRLGSGSRSTELNLIDYVRRQQPSSDVLFYSLVDSTFQSAQFERSDWRRAVPLPGRRLVSGSTFYVLYEVYNLLTDSDGLHHAEAVNELIARETRQAAVIPVPSRTISGPGPTAVVVERVHTMDLRPGPYLYVSRVRDLSSGRTASLTAEFIILPRRQP